MYTAIYFPCVNSAAIEIYVSYNKSWLLELYILGLTQVVIKTPKPYCEAQRKLKLQLQLGTDVSFTFYKLSHQPLDQPTRKVSDKVKRKLIEICQPILSETNKQNASIKAIIPKSQLQRLQKVTLNVSKDDKLLIKTGWGQNKIKLLTQHMAKSTIFCLVPAWAELRSAQPELVFIC